MCYEPAGYWDQLKAVLGSAKVSDPLVHDVRIAALCTSQGVRELWTVDRDFGRFGSSLSVRHPLIG